MERPRLLRALDSATARVRLLVAPAGYGKTTLAEQWVAAGNRRAAWYVARNASADVAVLSVGLAQAAATILEGCDVRLRERLTSTQRPGEEAEILAEILAEDLAGWPDDAWLVIDDYERIARSSVAESFVALVAGTSSIPILIASRRRPSWVTSRSILYGDVFELGPAALAMTVEEAGVVLAEWPAEEASGLTRLADGWPAVVGIAGVAGVTPPPEGVTPHVPDALYGFFAEEVYAGLDNPIQEGLARLAVAPVLDRAAAAAILGDELWRIVCREGLRSGILDERRGRLELHPLARSFLESRLIGRDREQQGVVERCVELYRQRRDWDALFELIERHDLVTELEQAFADALDELIDAARLATVDRWLAYAEARALDGPVFKLAAAELALRQGKHITAHTLIQAALKHLDDSDQLASRALSLAGRIAHVACRDEEALGLYRRAERAASTESRRKQAQWGQVMCAASLELEEARELIEAFADTVANDDPLDLVRLADRQLSFGFKFGTIATLDFARQVEELVPAVRDPVARCSFRATFAYALALAAEYEEALTAARALKDDAMRYRIAFSLPYSYTTQAIALAGLRDFAVANHALADAEHHARALNDSFAVQNAYAVRMRVLAQQGLFAEACAREPPAKMSGIPSMDGEALAARGLVLACIGRFGEALRLTEQVEQLTRAIEARVLVAGIRAIVAVKTRSSDLSANAEAFLDAACESRAIDLFVTCYRASADVLDVLLSSPTAREHTVFAIARAGDQALAEAVGRPPLDVTDPLTSLSVREREVYGLLCQGLSNREIAKMLFISEGTVKAHAHHVYDKLGIRSRTALALNAAARARHAAPATGSS